MDTKIKIEKNIVSESNVLKLFMHDVPFDFRQIPHFEAYYLSNVELEQLLLSWKKNIDRDSTLLSRQSLSTLTDLPQDALYRHLGQDDWRSAAQVSEIFRNPLICKNAGRLNLKDLQKNIREWILASGQCLNLIIAWGQPKRSAGGIKCMGPYADLAELFSITRLTTIVYAIEKILKRPVKLTVLTGGHRFYPALFTRPEMTVNYDQQRQEIADYMDDQQRIEFQPFIHDDEFLDDVIADKQLKHISEQRISSQFRTILLNIDWEHLLHPQVSLRLHNPHQIELPTFLSNWLGQQMLETIQSFIRQAIDHLLSNAQNRAAIMQCEDDETHPLLKELITFMQAVTWQSTRKYIAIQEMNTEKQQDTLKDHQFRLTVHEKENLRTLPAILTLGVNGGNQLSQHVMTFLENRKLHFGAFSEFWEHELLLIKLRPNSHYPLFGWLGENAQPLCITTMNSRELLPFLSLSSRLMN